LYGKTKTVTDMRNIKKALVDSEKDFDKAIEWLQLKEME
jgi:translation elongation factor EF-Ts